MRQTIAVAICVIVSLVVGAIATRYIHPHWAFATLHSLQLHAAGACVVAMLVALVVKRHAVVWLLFAASLALAAHAVVLDREFRATPAAADANAPTFKLLSFNILGDNYERADDLTRVIISSGADLVNVMEAEPLLPNIDEIAKTYPYRIGCGVIIRQCDQLMLSKTPLEAPAVRNLSDIFSQRFILAKVTVAGHPINFAGMHTTKPYFDNFHPFELTWAAYYLNQVQGPLLVSGDYNASSLPPDMRRFLAATGLRKAPDGEPATWPIGAGAFGVPIDHVYARAPLKIKSLERVPDAYGSNHYGLMAEIAITGEQ